MANVWSDMTVAQMVFLMKAANRERFRLEPGWEELAEQFFDGNVYNSMTHSAAAAFFFSAALAGGSCSPKEKTTISFLRKQYIPDLVKEEDDVWSEPGENRPESGRFWMRLLINNAYRRNVCPTVYLGELLAELSAAGINRNSRLSQLFGTLAGLDCWLDGMEGAFAAFRARLDRWNSTLRNMWIAIPREERPLPPAERPGGLAGDICKLIEQDVKQIILTGAPGTGKTRAAGEAASYFASLNGMSEKETCVLVPFHPSYDYTDFVEGLRPMQLASSEPAGPGRVEFVRLDGTFKAFCRKVVENNRANTGDKKGAGDPNCRYLFLIDEINRADLSKVFGELMFCLETDKRGRRVETQYSNLTTYDPVTRAPLAEDDVFASGFFVPENIYIIGTMNDIDRSVESMDFALRRRFTWLEVPVTLELLKSAFLSGAFSPALTGGSASQAAAQIMALNRVIAAPPVKGNRNGDSPAGLGGRYGLTRQYYISQGQFANLPDPLPENGAAIREWEGLPRNKLPRDLYLLLHFVWECRLQFLLREYVRGEKDSNVAEFLAHCRSALLTLQPVEGDSPS